MTGQSRSALPDEAIHEPQRLELLGQLAAGVAHDFANILQAAQGVARLLERAAEDPDRVRVLAQMLFETARRGILLTDRMLGFARRHHGGHPPDPTEQDPVCNPADVIKDVCHLLSGTLGPLHSLQCIVEEGGLPGLIRGTYGELEAAVMNLALNARDALPEGGEVTVKVVAEHVTTDALGLMPGLYARISVADTGVGMSAAVRERASEPFFTTKPPGKGTGLGLAGVKSFAERAGGKLRIESEEGHGTIVTFWLYGQTGPPPDKPGANAPAQADGSDPP